jgi:hypothetical protein
VQWLLNKLPAEYQTTANNDVRNAQPADDIANADAQIIPDALEANLRTFLAGFCSGYDIQKT